MAPGPARGAILGLSRTVAAVDLARFHAGHVIRPDGVQLPRLNAYAVVIVGAVLLLLWLLTKHAGAASRRHDDDHRWK